MFNCFPADKWQEACHAQRLAYVQRVLLYYCSQGSDDDLEFEQYSDADKKKQDFQKNLQFNLDQIKLNLSRMPPDMIYSLFVKLSQSIVDRLNQHKTQGLKIENSKQMSPIVQKIIRWVLDQRPPANEAAQEISHFEIDHFYAKFDSSDLIIQELLGRQGKLKRILLPGDDKHVHDFVQDFATYHIEQATAFKLQEFKIYHVPSGYSTLASYIAAHDPLYQEQVFAPFQL